MLIRVASTAFWRVRRRFDLPERFFKGGASTMLATVIGFAAARNNADCAARVLHETYAAGDAPFPSPPARREELRTTIWMRGASVRREPFEGKRYMCSC